MNTAGAQYCGMQAGTGLLAIRQIDPLLASSTRTYPASPRSTDPSLALTWRHPLRLLVHFPASLAASDAEGAFRIRLILKNNDGSPDHYSSAEGGISRYGTLTSVLARPARTVDLDPCLQHRSLSPTVSVGASHRQTCCSHQTSGYSAAPTLARPGGRRLPRRWAADARHTRPSTDGGRSIIVSRHRAGAQG